MDFDFLMVPTVFAGLMLIPALIVWFWKAKPTAALIVALLLFLVLTAISMFYLCLFASRFGSSFGGSSALEITPRVINNTVLATIGLIIPGVPVLAGIQWVSRRISRYTEG